MKDEMYFYKKAIILLLLVFVEKSIALNLTGEPLFIANLTNTLKISPTIKNQLMNMAASSEDTYHIFYSKTPPLFQAYPTLKDSVSYCDFANLPTPAYSLKTLNTHLNTSLYIKRDDLTGKIVEGRNIFGGNKVRKLEFLLADALNNGAETVLTFGCAGSNHLVATAAYAQHLGLVSHSMICPQPNSNTVQRNLLLMHHYGSNLHPCASRPDRVEKTVETYFASKKNNDNFPYFIPTGASTPLGVLGYVNAIFELANQIRNELIPEPDYIYVAAGSMGTAAGLLLGITSLQLKTQLKVVTVEPLSDQEAFNEIRKLFKETNNLLHEKDPSFSIFDFPSKKLTILEGYGGQEYGSFTPDGKNAFSFFLSYENILLDGTYTAKTVAGMLDDIEKNNLFNKNILYWHTFCANTPSLTFERYTQLPVDLHHYFETSAQTFE